MKFCLIVFSALCISVSSFGQYGTTDTMSYTSQYFKERRKLKISLPNEYADNPNRKYKVIYLFDAQSTALYDFAKATQSFLQSYTNFYFDPVILVGIETKNRHFEFLPKHLNTAASPQNYLYAGGADTLALSVENEVKPLIEKKYRTNGFTIGIGHSLGATFVTYCMLKFPKIFNAGICVSPNYVYDDEAIFAVFKNAVERNYLSGHFLYIAHGEGDEMEEKFKQSTIRFGNLLEESKTPNFNFKVDALNNTSHSTTPMEGIFKGLIFINNFMNLPYVKYKPVLDSSNSGSFIEYVKDYFKQQSLKTGASLPSVGELNVMAFNVFYANRKKEAIQLLEWAISLYPKDANLYDSMGEIQESAGNTERAKYYYNQGLSIIKSEKDQLSDSTYTSKIKWFNKRLDKLQQN